MSLERKATHSFAWLFSAGILSNIGRIGIFATLSRTLTKTDFGIYAAAMVVLGFAQMAETGFGNFILQKKEVEERHVGTAWAIVMTLSLTIMLLLILGAEWLAKVCRVPEVGSVIAIFAPLMLIKSFTTLQCFQAARELRFRLISKIETIGYFAGFGVCSITLAWAGFGYWALLMGTAVQFGLISLFYLFLIRQKLVLCFDWRALREMFHFGCGTSLAAIFSFIAKEGDYFIVGRIFGPGVLGIYNRAFAIMQLPVTGVVNALDRVLLPVLSKVQDDLSVLRQTLQTSVRLIYVIYLPLALVGVLAAPEIISTLLGARWGEAVTPFRLLMLGLMFRAGYKMAGSLLLVRGKTYTVLSLQMINAAAVVGGSCLGLVYGLNGACLGVVCGLGINFVLLNYCAARMVKLPLFLYFEGLWRTVPLLILTGVTITAALWLARAADWPALLNMTVALPLAMAVTISIALLTPDRFFPTDVSDFVRRQLTFLWKTRRSNNPMPA